MLRMTRNYAVLMRQAVWTILSFVLLGSGLACDSAPVMKDAKAPVAPALEGANAESLTPDDERAPDLFEVLLTTTNGDVVVEVHRDWAPRGADRFYTLVKSGFYDNAKFFRVVPGFVAQFGIAADPQVHAKWNGAPLRDDPVKQTNGRGTVTFATSGPNTRTSQLFINFADNSRLDSMGFSPFGIVTKGMEFVDQINPEYGEFPQQPLIEKLGDAYLSKEFPKLDGIVSAKVLSPESAKPSADPQPAATEATESSKP
ncbi:Peptidyl-prolyl cis-trans isomerase A precursor [Planctopirus ephydatiae]|jgi:peptidyl-prolyl cis-trans isomerase A (cyclophilin A)|uniref:Peptidyl-prolyl cis-trans isomerase n=1 Tax=Planctopirus ephydatiae TaxID=2528019 RepID=A0A518GTL3_9PLAN|nr:peptidylprolyl isomerase [Planctopirus ephydatiae]QDV31909.1 Peptidyl-prolyl cis-trans isomerase A precursor [Planctopirus ephydatiae]